MAYQMALRIFAPGDKVTALAGGPVMTVIKVYPARDTVQMVGNVVCEWEVENGQKQRRRYAAGQLRLLERG